MIKLLKGKLSWFPQIIVNCKHGSTMHWKTGMWSTSWVSQHLSANTTAIYVRSYWGVSSSFCIEFCVVLPNISCIWRCGLNERLLLLNTLPIVELLMLSDGFQTKFLSLSSVMVMYVSVLCITHTSLLIGTYILYQSQRANAHGKQTAKSLTTSTYITNFNNESQNLFPVTCAKTLVT